VLDSESTIRSSRIGTNKGGTAAVPNLENGIYATFNTVEGPGDGLTIGGPEDPTPGGACDGDCNLVSGNGASGIQVRVSGTGAERTDGLKVEGNYVGTGVAGTAALPNGGDSGLRLWGGLRSAEVDGNLISGNDGDGILILAGDDNFIGPAGTSIAGNTIGLTADGTTALGNGGHGIRVDRSLSGGPEVSGTTIGGPEDPTPGGACDGACNLISGNAQSGVVLFDDDSEGGPIAGTEILGNYIGTDASGTADRGNAGWAIQLSGVSGTTVGEPGSPNVLSGNGTSGVLLIGSTVSGNVIQSNLIGVGADGSSPLGNTNHGVEASNGADLSTIGGMGVGAGNVIAHNGKAGVGLVGGLSPALDTPILGNSVFANGELGIDLRDAPLVGGVTENGTCEEATGANRCQEFPALTAAAGGSAAAAGTLASDPGKTYRIEVFASSEADPSGNGEGERLLGAVTVTTDGAGNASWLFTDPAATLADGEVATATATELAPGGAPLSTSEFSDALAAPTCNLGGGAGDDPLTGTAAAEVICGFAGNDTIAAGGGSDAVFGGEGDDTIDVADGEADALVDCGPGTDTVSADAETIDSAAIFVGCETVTRPALAILTPPELAPPPADSSAPKASVYKCKGKRATIVGTSKKETIKGTGKADVIVALGGNDTVKGLGGNDTVCGGNGNDTIKGGPGNDRLLGEAGNDKLLGEKGNDRLDGGAAKDTLKGGPGNDRLKGAGGKPDLCDGQSGKKDRLDGKKAGCEKRRRIP
jgi:Ca2+-binding RTX toxin-like protein